MKPDITIVNEDEKHCVVVELTCPYEISKEYLKQRKEDKVKKYKSLVTDELWQVSCETGEIIGITIGAMGKIMEDSHKSLKRLGLIAHCSALQMTAMNSSVIILNAHPQQRRLLSTKEKEEEIRQ